MATIDWKMKIFALLHDPLTKPLNIKHHEKIANEILKEVFNEEFKEYKRGEEDYVASALDRFPIPFEKGKNRIIVDFEVLKDFGFIHPLSAKKLNIYKEFPGKFIESENIKVLKERLKRIVRANTVNGSINFENCFHAIWWHLPDIIDLAQFIPADTRIPNHSIIDHLDVTSALSTCINGSKIDASLISVSIGPVQDFIKAARKTQDLWSGSYLLSYITYKGIEYIGKEYGFDSIIYPSLRNLSFVKETLKNWNVQIFDDLNKLRIPSKKVASIPNKFTAIVPSCDKEEIIMTIEQKIKNEWKNLVQKVIEYIEEENITLLDDKYFKEQIKTFPEIYVVSQRFMDPQDNSIKAFKNFIKDEDLDISEEVKMLKQVRELGGYTPNSGALYRFTYELLMRKSAAVKSIRAFEYFKDESTKNGKILDGDDFSGEVKAIFKVKDNEKIDFLGIVNLTKRLLSKALNMNKIKFPSVDIFAGKNKEYLEKILRFNLENNYKNNYFAVLIMDGDKMGKWLNGEKAPMIKELFNGFKTLNELENFLTDQKEFLEWIKKRKTIQPAYHRAISRTLNIFSNLVEKVVKNYGGELIYSGGDDVLALLPATTVLQCANDIRKMYSGIGNIRFEDNGRKYLFKNEMIFIDEIPYSIMMGKAATMSAGIAVVNKKFPLSIALDLARESEKNAKKDYDRNAFVISIARRSGQITSVGSKWSINLNNSNYYEDTDYDVIQNITKIGKLFMQEKISQRTLRKLLLPQRTIIGSEVKENYLLLNKSEYVSKYIPYVLKRSTEKLSKDEKNMFIEFFENVLELEGKPYTLKTPVELLISQLFLWRGGKDED